MKVHKPSTQIKIKLSGATACINEVIVGDTYVMYKCSYYINSELKNVTLQEYEFEIINGSKKQIGFHNTKQ